MNYKIGKVSGVILASMVIVSLFGAACDLGKRSESPSEPLRQATQGPVPASCLIEGQALPHSCQGTLPQCLQEDGSGPGVMCHWTDPDTGAAWYNDGDETNDPQDVP